MKTSVTQIPISIVNEVGLDIVQEELKKKYPDLVGLSVANGEVIAYWDSQEKLIPVNLVSNLKPKSYSERMNWEANPILFAIRFIAEQMNLTNKLDQALEKRFGKGEEDTHNEEITER